jgi:hypothetical protein
MAALNEAYRVLRHPGRRAAYDAELAARVERGPMLRRPTRPTGPVPLRRVEDRGPARYPWKLVVVSAALGAAVVLAAAALTDEPPPPRVDNVLRPGSCVAIEANEDAREVTCTGDAGDLVVDRVVPLDGVCPAGLSAYRDRQGLGYACVNRRGPETTAEGASRSTPLRKWS